MDAAERSAFDHELEQNLELKQELKRHKDFLTLLHSLTSKITLTAAGVKEKLQSVIITISDYEEIVDEIIFENGNPTTMTSHIWFKKPDLYHFISYSKSTTSISRTGTCVWHVIWGLI